MTDLQWGRLSNDAFNVALFSYVAAMVGYFAFMAFRKHTLWPSRGRSRRSGCSPTWSAS